MRKSGFLLILFVSFYFTSVTGQYLRVSSDSRYIEKSNGEPFLWLGDTAWELFHKLDREEATEYLTNRAEKGFTVIQAVVLAENDGLRSPNPYGDVPFEELDPTRPNEDYFKPGEIKYVRRIREPARWFLIRIMPKFLETTWGKDIKINLLSGSSVETET